MAREIEKKYRVKLPKTQAVVDRLVRDVLGIPTTQHLTGIDHDVFFRAPDDTVDFIRLRRDGTGYTELTVKKTDRGTIEDRLEINLEDLSYEKAFEFATLLFGKPIGEISKSYSRFYRANDVVVSTARVIVDGSIFLEVEGPTMQEVEVIADRLEEALDLEPETRSMFQIYVAD